MRLSAIRSRYSEYTSEAALVEASWQGDDSRRFPVRLGSLNRLSSRLQTFVDYLSKRVSSHHRQNLANAWRVHEKPTAAPKQAAAEIAESPVQSLAAETVGQNGFILDEKVRFLELLSKLRVCCVVTHVVFCGLCGDYECPASCFTHVKEHSRNRRSTSSAVAASD